MRKVIKVIVILVGLCFVMNLSEGIDIGSISESFEEKKDSLKSYYSELTSFANAAFEKLEVHVEVIQRKANGFVEQVKGKFFSDDEAYAVREGYHFENDIFPCVTDYDFSCDSNMSVTRSPEHVELILFDVTEVNPETKCLNLTVAMDTDLHFNYSENSLDHVMYTVGFSEPFLFDYYTGEVIDESNITITYNGEKYDTELYQNMSESEFISAENPDSVNVRKEVSWTISYPSFYDGLCIGIKESNDADSTVRCMRLNSDVYILKGV